MSWSNFGILLAIGALHSASLWLITLAAKRSGANGLLLRLMPLLLGVPSAYLAFPLAMRVVAGVELAGVEDKLLSAAMGLPAAAGAEAVYRVVASVLPKITDAIVGRINGGGAE